MRLCLCIADGPQALGAPDYYVVCKLLEVAATLFPFLHAGNQRYGEVKKVTNFT